MSRPLHLRPSALALVFLGGTLGTAARLAVDLAVPGAGDVPVATLGINVAGAFLLGALLGALAVRGPDTDRRRRVRLLLGTGVLGGFTTYSALAVDTAVLLGAGSSLLAIAYGVGTLLIGTAMAGAGIALTTSCRRSSVRV